MASNKKTVPFYGTEEQKEQLLKVIQKLRDEKGCLMPIMQKAQDIYDIIPTALIHSILRNCAHGRKVNPSQALWIHPIHGPVQNPAP